MQQGYIFLIRFPKVIDMDEIGFNRVRILAFDGLEQIWLKSLIQRKVVRGDIS